MQPPTTAQTNLQRLLDIIAILRSPEGCPWDRNQTSQTLRPYLLEEAYEVLDAIDGGHPEELCDELGDLLLQIVLLARLHEEAGLFDFADVCNGIGEKLVRRHPHVFGQGSNTLSAAQLDLQWQRIKAEERAQTPKPIRQKLQALPSLQLAQTTLIADPVRNQPTEVGLRHRLESYLGCAEAGALEPTAEALADLLFDLARSAACLDINAELALRQRVLQEEKSSGNEKT